MVDAEERACQFLKNSNRSEQMFFPNLVSLTCSSFRILEKIQKVVFSISKSVQPVTQSLRELYKIWFLKFSLKCIKDES